MRRCKAVAYNFVYGEKKKSYGSLNADKAFYVIRIKAEGIGLMAYYASIVGSIRYALVHNWIPIVDMKNYKNAYLEEDKLGKENSWEYYFKQPTTTSLDEVYHSKYVVLSNVQTSFTGSSRKLYSEVIGGYDYFKLIAENMKFSDQFSCILEEQYNALFPKGKKVLGVASRGTDMIGFSGHSIQPTREPLLERTIEKMNDYGYEYIFLSTEEDSVVDYLKSNLGVEKVITDSEKRCDEYVSSGKYVLSDMNFGRKNEKRLQGD